MKNTVLGTGIMVKSKYNFEREEKFEKGFIQIKFDVKKGKIEHAKIFGDFFGEGTLVI